MTTTPGRIYHDGNPVGDLIVSVYEANPEYETLRSEGWPVPDPEWSQRHGGHDHVWEQVEGILVVAHAYRDSKPCDGACGDSDHEVTVWKCNVFHNVLQPGTKHSGPITRTIERHTDLTVRVSTRIDGGLPARLDGCEIRWPTEGGYGFLALPAEMPRGDVTIENGRATEAEYTGRISPR